MRVPRFLSEIISEIAVWWGRFWPGVWTVRGWLPIRPAWVLLLVLAAMGTALAWPTGAAPAASLVILEGRTVPIATYGPWYSLNPETGACEGPHLVNTQKLATETEAEWSARHKAAVRSELASWPPAPAGSCP